MFSTPGLGRRLASVFAALALIACASTARAAFWSQDFNISGSEVNDTFTPLNNQRFMAVDDSNNLYVAFYDNRNKILNGDSNFEIYFRRFIYNFGSPSITRVTDRWGNSKYPTIATLNWGLGDQSTVDDSARIYIAWQDARLFSIPVPPLDSKSYTIFFRTFQSLGGVGFGPEIQVSPYDSLSAAVSPVVAADTTHQVWIVWQKADPGAQADLHYAVYNARTRVMGAEQLLTTDPALSASPSIAITRAGVVHVVWVDTRSGKQQIWTKRYVPGSGWTADEEIVFSPASGQATAPSIIATYTGHLHLVWKDTRDGNAEIYYKEYLPGIGWDPIDTRLTTNTFTQSEPQVDADPMNNAYVVWTDQRLGAANTDIFFEQRTGGVWQPEVPLVYSATDTTNQRQYAPGITHDGNGNAYVAWTDERLPSSGGRNKDVYYKVGVGEVTAVEVVPAAPLARLLRNYPNPFNPVTKVEFRLDRDAQVSLRVFDVHGRLVRTLVEGYIAAGKRTIEWDGKGDRGESLASGTYFMRLTGGGDYLTRTVSLVK